ncbi:MAG TPA: molybdopterin-synthase adenylyltransferase MoeB, partial [Candidatus Krumholzibacteria bacterium]|nr:molybdopterin-synthase adenylyltransferase MoeB [Candidatus Krumholzibacteria bacterium]
LVLPEVGPGGQQALKRARVLLVGAGGLGAPAGLYLAAAGIGHLTLVDDDRVEASNLQRQVIFGAGDVGRLKTEVARERLAALNPHITVEARSVRLAAANALDLIRGHDLVVDGSDNFATRYLVNDACVMLGVPHVHGSIHRFEGQVSLFAAAGGPCYRCIFPAAPAPGRSADCAQAGVLGVLPGVIGAIQATEAIKWILQAGTSLRGRLLRVDALSMRFHEIRVARDPLCPVCGDHPVIRTLTDSESCTVSGEEATPVSIPEITVKELKRRLDAGDAIDVIDVREPHEHQMCNIGGRLIPMGQLPGRLHELDETHEIVVYCRTGSRSSRVVEFLQDAGFEKVLNLKGGIHAWASEIDPSLPLY